MTDVKFFSALSALNVPAADRKGLLAEYAQERNRYQITDSKNGAFADLFLKREHLKLTLLTLLLPTVSCSVLAVLLKMFGKLYFVKSGLTVTWAETFNSAYFVTG